MKKSLVISGIVGCVAIIAIILIFLNKSKTYTVTFISDNGSANQLVEVKKNNTIEKISDPKKEGYIFEGWYIGEEKFDFTKKISENINITAKWKKIVLEDEMLVTFDTDGGNTINEESVKKGNIITKPTNPTKKGYIFVEWQLDGKPYDFKSKVEKDITLKATWKEDIVVQVTRYTVTFDSNGGSAVANKTVVENERVSKPVNPGKNNYNFVEWQLNGKTYDFNSRVTKNITLKAIWKEKDKVTINFDSDGGTAVTARTIYKGDALGTLPNPTKSGFTFDGWFNSNDKYADTSAINDNLTLKAKWIDNDEIALNNAKATIKASYPITSGGQVISESYTGCTIVHDNPSVIASITRDRSDANVTLNFSITCGNKTGTKSATGVIKASPYTYTATANGNMINHDLLIKEGNTTISNSGDIYDMNGEHLSEIIGGAGIITNNDINNFPNFKIVINADANTIYVIAKV